MALAVTEFQSLLGQLAQELQGRIVRLLDSLAGIDETDLMAFITDAAPALLNEYLTASADLTASWYEDQNPASDYIAEPADLPADDALAIAARWAMTQADRATAWTGAATKALFDTSRETVKVNAAREGVRWVRHAQENACGFCRILAIRSLDGLSYGSEGITDKIGADGKPTGDKTLVVVKGKNRAPGEEYHDHCNCTAVPLRDGTYAAPSYLRQWKNDYKAAREIAGGKASAIANAMDYLPGGRRYKGDDAPPYEPRQKPVNLDAPKTAPKPAPKAAPEPAAETDVQMAKRLLPGLQKSLADLRAQGLPENSPQIQYHLTQIARWKKALAAK